MLDREFTAGRMTATTRRRIATLPRRPGLSACTTRECVARLGRDRPRLRVNSRSSIWMSLESASECEPSAISSTATPRARSS